MKNRILGGLFALLLVFLIGAHLNTSGRCPPDACELGDSNVTSLSLITDGGTVTVDGSVTSLKPVNTAASGTLTLNTVTMATATADYTIPDNCDSATGYWTTVVMADANETASLLLADSSDTIVVEGLELDAGDELDSPTAANDSAGSSITLLCSEADKWFSIGRVGTWVDGGAS